MFSEHLKWLPILLFSLTAHAGCDSLFSRLLPSRLDGQPYLEARARFREALQNESPVHLRAQAKTIEEKVAFLEAVLEKSGAEPSPHAIAKSLRAAAKRMDWENGPTPAQLDRLVSDYLLARFGDPASLRSWLSSGGAPVERFLRQKMEAELLRGQLEALLPARPPSALYERWNQLLADHRVLAKNISFGIQSLASWSGEVSTGRLILPLGSPGWDAFNGKLLNKELLEQARRNGLDSVYPRIYAEFKDSAQADLYFSLLTKAWKALSWSTVAYDAYSEFRNARAEAKKNSGPNVDWLDSLADKNSLAEQMLEKWQIEFRAERGRQPSAREIREMRLYLNRLATGP